LQSVFNFCFAHLLLIAVFACVQGDNMSQDDVITQLMLALLFTHELDAMTQSEWRLLYVLRDLGNKRGRWWFVVVHVPLFWGLIALTQHEQVGVQHAGRMVLAGFCIVHALLHWRLRNNPFYTFTSPLSWGLILIPATLGIVYLLINS
jgi:hypothetical protein